MARRSGGRWLLRIEDLDTPRVVPGIADDMLRTLEALGFYWDGEILWQSRRQEAYGKALDRLMQAGVAYPCGCSRAEIARIGSAPHFGEQGPVYPGICRNGLPSGKNARSIRVRVNDEPICFHDGLMGIVCQNLAIMGGDFVVKRADGLFAYQLAVVVDDAETGVNQVVRGADLLTSTPRQIHLQRLFGYSEPAYFHFPLVTDRDGAKLSKRDNAVSLVSGRDLEREGHLLLFDSLRFLGQNPPLCLREASCSEILSWSIEHFSLSAVPRFSGPFPCNF